MITTKRNKQHGSKSTNYNPRTWPFEPAEESTFFPRDPLYWVMEAKNVNSSYIFDLWSHVIAKRGNRSQEIAGRWQNKSVCQRNMSPGCCVQSFEQENIVWWNTLLSWKTFTINIKFCNSSNLLFFYKLLIGRKTNFFVMYCYFRVIRLKKIFDQLTFRHGQQCSDPRSTTLNKTFRVWFCYFLRPQVKILL